MTGRSAEESIRVALTGAGGAFARTFLAQLRDMPGVRAGVLVDLDLRGLAAVLAELGHAEGEYEICESLEQVEDAVSAGRIALVGSVELCASQAYDVLVEATGSPRAGYAFAARAIEEGRHVVMVSKEVETVAGVRLSQLARDRGVRYLPGRGDQPANLLALLTWVRALGLEIVAVGKSSEYDLRFDPETGVLTQEDVVVQAPGLASLLRLGEDVPRTLAARDRAVGLDRVVTADHCEMGVVGQYSGYVPDVETLHYPIARPDELADIYALSEDGGIVGRPGVVDVFSMLRLPGEASFAGGEFVVVKTNDAVSWELLRGKGHVVSRDGKYACIYTPYHYMGVETPLSVLEAVAPVASPLQPRQHTVLAGRAEKDLEPGTVLRVTPHSHAIAGLASALLAAETADDEIAPFYLIDEVTVVRPIRAGDLIVLDDLEGYDPVLLEAFRSGLALSR